MNYKSFNEKTKRFVFLYEKAVFEHRVNAKHVINKQIHEYKPQNGVNFTGSFKKTVVEIGEDFAQGQPVSQRGLITTILPSEITTYRSNLTKIKNTSKTDLKNQGMNLPTNNGRNKYIVSNSGKSYVVTIWSHKTAEKFKYTKISDNILENLSLKEQLQYEFFKKVLGKLFTPDIVDKVGIHLMESKTPNRRTKNNSLGVKFTGTKREILNQLKINAQLRNLLQIEQENLEQLLINNTIMSTKRNEKGTVITKHGKKNKMIIPLSGTNTNKWVAYRKQGHKHTIGMTTPLNEFYVNRTPVTYANASRPNK